MILTSRLRACEHLFYSIIYAPVLNGRFCLRTQSNSQWISNISVMASSQSFPSPCIVAGKRVTSILFHNTECSGTRLNISKPLSFIGTSAVAVALPSLLVVLVLLLVLFSPDWTCGAGCDFMHRSWRWHHGDKWARWRDPWGSAVMNGAKQCVYFPWFMSLVASLRHGVLAYMYEKGHVQDFVFEYGAATSSWGTCWPNAAHVLFLSFFDWSHQAPKEGEREWEGDCLVENCTGSQNVWQVEIVRIIVAIK